MYKYLPELFFNYQYDSAVMMMDLIFLDVWQRDAIKYI